MLWAPPGRELFIGDVPSLLSLACFAPGDPVKVGFAGAFKEETRWPRNERASHEAARRQSAVAASDRAHARARPAAARRDARPASRAPRRERRPPGAPRRRGRHRVSRARKNRLAPAAPRADPSGWPPQTAGASRSFFSGHMFHGSPDLEPRINLKIRP